MRLLIREDSSALVANLNCATIAFADWCKSRIYPGAGKDAQVGFESCLTGKMYQDTMPISCNHIVLNTRGLIDILDSNRSRKLGMLMLARKITPTSAAVSGALCMVFTQNRPNAWENLLGQREPAEEGVFS